MIKIKIKKSKIEFENITDEAIELVDKVTKYPVKNAWFSKAYREKRWDGLVHLMTYSKKFGYRVYSGCLYDVILAFDENEIEYEIIDLRNNKLKKVDHKWTGKIMSHGELVDIQPRDYQINAVRSVLKWKYPKGRCILHMPVRSGKTVTAGLLIGALNVRTLFVATSDLIMNQTVKLFSTMFDTEIGVVGAGVWEPTDLTVSIMQTLVSRIKPLKKVDKENNKLSYLPKGDELVKWINSYDLIVLDECFPPFTKIDGKYIKDLKINDEINSLNVQTGEFRKNKITHIFKNKVNELIEIILSNGETIFCTKNHPFYTKNNWKKAKYLNESDFLLKFTGENNAKDKTKRFCLSHLWEKFHLLWRTKNNKSYNKKRKSILFKKLQQKICESLFFNHNVRNKQKIQETIHRNEIREQKSNKKKRSKRKIEQNIERERAQTTNSRREWVWSNFTSKIISKCLKLENRIYFTNKNIQINGLSNSLQIGHSKRQTKNSNRSRWIFSWLFQNKRKRQEKNKIFKWVRVESIKIHKQGSSRKFREMCPEGIVYNLEIEDFNTYFANNYFVHNCHHMTADKWKEVALSSDAYWKVGLSATLFLDRHKQNEKENIWLKACTGDVAYKITTKRLIEDGWLVKPTIEIYKLKLNELEGHDWNDDNVYQCGITENCIRNNFICEKAFEALQENSRTMIIAQEHVQIDYIYNILIQLTDEVERLTGKVTGQKRRSIIKKFKEGKIKILIGNVFGEGIDIPECDVVINAEGGQSKKKAIQRMRNLTPSPGKDKVRFIDFYDEHNKYLLKHSKKRLKTYENEDCFDIIIVE